MEREGGGGGGGGKRRRLGGGGEEEGEGAVAENYNADVQRNINK